MGLGFRIYRTELTALQIWNTTWDRASWPLRERERLRFCGTHLQIDWMIWLSYAGILRGRNVIWHLDPCLLAWCPSDTINVDSRNSFMVCLHGEDLVTRFVWEVDLLTYETDCPRPCSPHHVRWIHHIKLTGHCWNSVQVPQKLSSCMVVYPSYV